MTFLRRHDQGCKTVAEAEHAAGYESPRLREVGAVDFGRGSVRIGRARAAGAGVLVDHGTNTTAAAAVQSSIQRATKNTNNESREHSPGVR